MSASPILPAPRIAITLRTLSPRYGARPARGSGQGRRARARPGREAGSASGGRSGAGDQRTGEEGQVRGAFGEPPDQVGVPVAAVRKIHAHLGARAGQTLLLARPDPVEHLVLEIPRAVAGQMRLRARDL